MFKEPVTRIKIIKTGNLYLSYLTLGVATAITGPCLLDLQRLVNTDTRHIAWIYTSRSIGHLLGAILGGILLDLFKSKQAVLTGCNLLVMATMIGIPFNRNVETLVGLMIVNGIALGAIETGGNVMCLQLWGKDSNPFFQALHFTFGLGGLVSPLIAAPFLENFEVSETDLYIEEKDPSFNFQSNILNDVTNITYPSPSNPKIVYPFSIIGAFAFLVSISHFLVCIISPREEEGLKHGKADNSDRGSLFMFVTLFLTFLLFVVLTGTEIGYGQTLTTYAVKGTLHLDTTVGSYMTSAFWGSFTLSRLVSVFLAMKFSSIKMIIGDICIVAISALILLFLMPKEWALWLASIVFGIGIASAYAACVGWLDTHINVTNKISAILTVGCATGQMLVPFIIAYFIEDIPDIFIYVAASTCVLMAIFLLALHLVFKYEKKVKALKMNNSQVISIWEA